MAPAAKCWVGSKWLNCQFALRKGTQRVICQIQWQSHKSRLTKPGNKPRKNPFQLACFKYTCLINAGAGSNKYIQNKRGKIRSDTSYFFGLMCVPVIFVFCRWSHWQNSSGVMRHVCQWLLCNLTIWTPAPSPHPALTWAWGIMGSVSSLINGNSLNSKHCKASDYRLKEGSSHHRKSGGCSLDGLLKCGFSQSSSSSNHHSKGLSHSRSGRSEDFFYIKVDHVLRLEIKA